MKKYIVLLLCAVLLLSGCAEQKRWEEQKAKEERAKKNEEFDKQLAELDTRLDESKKEREENSVCYKIFGIAETPLSLKTGSGDNGGKAYILKIPKEDYLAASYDDLKEITEYIGSFEYSSNDRYFSVSFDDGTGIQYPGFNTFIPDYGTLDNEFCIVKSYGYINDEGDCYVLYDYDTEKPVTDAREPVGINGIE